MKLYQVAWALYPRRIAVYLEEKGIAGIEMINFDVMKVWPDPVVKELSPIGTLPILDIGTGQLIRTSTAILGYLEDRFPTPDMIGATPEIRAKTRELMEVADEVNTQLVLWAKNASPLFARNGGQDMNAATLAANAYHDRLALMERLLGEAEGPFVSGSRISVVDCVLMASLQFAQEVYSVPIPDFCPKLLEWHDNFSKRPSAKPPTYPEPVLELSRRLPSFCPSSVVPPS
ncbi:glutathione S-transferase family protein [Yoonia sp.]|uniref:glutathione S-transferase family protein n=1 Tax=Yoonia sp. TaxID=2212373 RepID=UPI00391DB24A